MADMDEYREAAEARARGRKTPLLTIAAYAGTAILVLVLVAWLGTALG
ncbi:hypothetical protein [Streptomyces sp. NPDC088915]